MKDGQLWGRAQLPVKACTRRLGNCKHGPWARGEAGLAGDAQAEVIEANLSSG